MAEQIICAICKSPVTKDQASIDHLRPAGGVPTQIDVQTVHIGCNRTKRSWWRRLMRRIGYWRYKLQMFIDRMRASK
jgi:5-methylcytosine-specific restriction endonuclease McrA